MYIFFIKAIQADESLPFFYSNKLNILRKITNHKLMKVELVKYSPKWLIEFEDEKIRLTTNIKYKKVLIEHIGSTAIPNISSKPVIDILIGVDNIKNLDLLIPDLEKCGYEYISKYENIFPQRRFFKMTMNKYKKYNIHAVNLDSHFRSRHLIFRDWLRNNEKDRIEYENLKLSLAENEWTDTNDYAFAKTDFIRKIENKALIELTLIFENTEIEAKADMFDAYSEIVKSEIDVQYKKSDNGAYAFKCNGLPPYFNRIIGAGLKSEITDE